jgi:hypothetical protein
VGSGILSFCRTAIEVVRNWSGLPLQGKAIEVVERWSGFPPGQAVTSVIVEAGWEGVSGFNCRS